MVYEVIEIQQGMYTICRLYRCTTCGAITNESGKSIHDNWHVFVGK